MIVNNPKYNSLPEQVEQNRKDIQEIKESVVIDMDDFLSTTSNNAVQNRVITTKINEIETDLSNEELAREQADNTLQTNIENGLSDEQLARQQADNGLIESITNLNTKVNNLSMLPSNHAQYNGQSTGLALPVQNALYFTANVTGFAICRFNVSQAGNILLRLTGSSNEYMADISVNMLAGTNTIIIPLKQNQQLSCVSFSTTISWSDIYMIHSQQQ